MIFKKNVHQYVTNFTLTFLVHSITNKNNGFHNCKQ